MMMNFLDLSTATEEERRLIKELLSDTSVVNFAQLNNDDHLQVSSSPTTSSSSSIINTTTTTAPTKQEYLNKNNTEKENAANLINHTKDNSSCNLITSTVKPGFQSHVATNLHTINPVPHQPQQESHQNQNQHQHHLQQQHQPQPPHQTGSVQPAVAGDMNSVIGLDMSGQRQPYPMRSHMHTAYPGPAHMFSGPLYPPFHYIVPVHHGPYLNFVLPQNPPPLVPSRLVSPQATQTPTSNNLNNSHHRSHSNHHPHHQRGHRQYSNTNQSLNNHNHQDHKGLNNFNNTSHTRPIKQNTSPTSSHYKNLENNDNTNELVIKESINNTQAPNFSPNSLSEKAAVSSDEGFETPSSLDASKQSHEIPIQLSNDNDCNTIQSEETQSSTIINNKSSDTSSGIINHNSINSSNNDNINNNNNSNNNHNKNNNNNININININSSSSSNNDIDNPGNAESNNIRSEDNDCQENNIADETDQQSGSVAWTSSSSKSWASLFKRGEGCHLSNGTSQSDGNNVSKTDSETNISTEDDVENKQVKFVDSSTRTKITSEELRSREVAKRALDKVAPKVAQRIKSINLKHSLPFLKPRGFINKGNGCYINATLQALIACPPFYNLMKEIGELKCLKRENSCTPILDSFAELFTNFPPLDSSRKMKQTNNMPAEQKFNIQNLQAESIEPKCIYNVLGNIKSECLKGAQEDAEEFLSSLLNGLHDEMISLGELNHSNTNGVDEDEQDSADDLNINDDNNVWRDVGHKNRSLPVRSAKATNTPISDIFGGWSFSLRTAGKDRCGHRSPFFDLQLDISSDNVKSLQDAIKSFTAPEIIHDFYCSKTKQKLDAQRRTSLDQLPPILILHLKQFVYTLDHGLKKLMKKIEYPIDFELPESCLYERNSMDKSLRTSRTYKLLAVVYHDGKEAVKGHYLTDVYHIGSSQWIRCDDSNLKVVPSPRIESPDSYKTPYLLFYRRLNTLGRAQQTNNHDNNSSSGNSKRKN